MALPLDHVISGGHTPDLPPVLNLLTVSGAILRVPVCLPLDEGNQTMSNTSIDQEALLALASDIIVSHVGNNTVASAELPSLIASVYGALAGLGKPVVRVEERPAAAVSVRASVKPDHMVCLEDGKKMKMLKRHLMTDHGLTPEQYRQRWNLPADYPMVASNYSEKRRELAVSFGLGRKPGAKVGRRRKLAAPAQG
jgi:predicted transcriptional regulator